ncbi:MAG: hypothetical protein JXM73_00175 [Anaerolineae bacterium]|nr:hypothetical protein [Anaerolineae bacterium]
MTAKPAILLGAVTGALVVLLGFGIGLAQPSAAALGPDQILDAGASSGPLAQSPHPTPHAMGGMSPTERLAVPPMSDPPTQIELGHHEYWMSCMVCHGDKGQGLTEEWRSVLDPEDQNCWQAKCHGAAHPPYGFEIPRTSPLVMGTGALSGYRTAADLFEFLRVEMPWSYPALFEDKDYWQLTAFLADVNNIDIGQDPLGPDNADQIFLLPQLVQSHHSAIGIERVIAGVMVGLLLGAAAFYWLLRGH